MIGSYYAVDIVAIPPSGVPAKKISSRSYLGTLHHIEMVAELVFMSRYHCAVLPIVSLQQNTLDELDTLIRNEGDIPAQRFCRQQVSAQLWLD